MFAVLTRSETGKVDGVAGNVDLDKFKGSENDLKNLIEKSKK
ncbi:MAG: hypothetical protein ABUK01_08370 [Leptospirales bacterium]